MASAVSTADWWETEKGRAAHQLSAVLLVFMLMQSIPTAHGLQQGFFEVKGKLLVLE